MCFDNERDGRLYRLEQYQRQFQYIPILKSGCINQVENPNQSDTTDLKEKQSITIFALGNAHGQQ